VVFRVAQLQVGSRRELHVAAHARRVLPPCPGQIDVEARVGAVEGHRLRLALELVIGKEVHAVLADRPAEGAADLLIRVRQDALLDEVSGVEAIVAEVAGERAGGPIRPRLGNRVDDHALRPALAGVEPVADHFELGDRVAAVAGLLLRAANELRHLLPIDVDLEEPLAILRHFRRGVGAAPRREHAQIHPVPAVDRQFLHLAGIDVAAHRRGRRLDERCFLGDSDRLLHAGDGHLEVERHLAADEQLHAGARDGREPGKFGRDAVDAGANRDSIQTPLVGHGDERVARRFVRRGHGHAGQHAARAIPDRPGQGGFLRRRPQRQRD
jgi:hypothetical protein